jgi:hypothetical protein
MVVVTVGAIHAGGDGLEPQNGRRQHATRRAVVSE